VAVVTAMEDDRTLPSCAITGLISTVWPGDAMGGGEGGDG
jgi:hypothetical protein